MNHFEPDCEILLQLLEEWEAKFAALPEDLISNRLNSQNRSVRQILGHLVDSASNNIHRMVHLQYRENPCSFPNYATFGNNDRWIAIQNYQHEDWQNLIQLWKYSNLHLVHVIRNLDSSKLDNQWISGANSQVSLGRMIADYLPHFRLHLGEMEELINR